MRKLVVRIARSKAFKLVATGGALLAGIDDLIELYFGIEDAVGLDVAHGVVFMALSGILDPLSRLVSEDTEPLIDMAEKN